MSAEPERVGHYVGVEEINAVMERIRQLFDRARFAKGPATFPGLLTFAIFYGRVENGASEQELRDYANCMIDIVFKGDTQSVFVLRDGDSDPRKAS